MEITFSHSDERDSYSSVLVRLTHSPLLVGELPPDCGGSVGDIEGDGIEQPVAILRVDEQALRAADYEAAP